MKKICTFLFAMLVIFSTLTAQQFHIEKSQGFDEPDLGWNKLLQLKNGNTFFFHTENKEGIVVVVYDKARKVIAHPTLTSKLWDEDKLKASKIAGLYEINGEPVIFLIQANDDKEPNLIRIRLNGTTGAIVKEEVLGHLPRTSGWGGFAIVFGHADANDIIVEKDPASDCYAVIYFNGFAHNPGERIKVAHYDGNHKVLSEAFYESPKGAFKYLRYIGSVVDGSKRIYIATYGYNANSDDEDARVIVSCLNAGSKDFNHNLLNFSVDFDDTKSVMLYNRNNNKIQLLTLSLTSKKRNGFSGKTTSTYLELLSYIDPETLAVTDVKPVVGQMVGQYVHTNIDPDYDFYGLPQQMVINKDNTTTILSEEIRTEVVRNQYGAVIKEKTGLGAVGISELNDTGAEIHGYAINKKQEAQGILPFFYVSSRSKGVFSPPFQNSMVKSNTNQFMSFDYINAVKNRYIIFNDLPENYEKGEDERKRRTMSTVSSSNTICFKLGDGKIEKFFLFGEPDDHQSTFSFIQASDFNRDINNTYATLIIERQKKDKEAKIAWVTFE